MDCIYQINLQLKFELGTRLWQHRALYVLCAYSIKELQKKINGQLRVRYPVKLL